MCSLCERDLPARTRAYWLPDRRVVQCVDCVASQEKPADAPLPENEAGTSARHEHERRQARRVDRQRDRYGSIGGWLASHTAGPQNERAWAKGAVGEETNARRLEKRLRNTSVIVLHDRKVSPKSKSNIDHIAIGPGGVTVIDSKNLQGKVKVDWRGGLFSERRFDLYIGGRRRTNLVEGVERQVAAVQAVLGDSELGEVEVVGALCMANVADLPLIGHPKLRNVAVDGTRRIAKIAARPGPLDAQAIQKVASVIGTAMPPA